MYFTFISHILVVLTSSIKYSKEFVLFYWGILILVC